MEDAEAVRQQYHGVQWPRGTGKQLAVEFVEEDAARQAIAALEAPPKPATPATGRASNTPTAPVARPAAESRERPAASKPTREERKAEEPSAPVLSLDDLFRRTKTQPALYYLPLSDAEVAAKKTKVAPAATEVKSS